ncbi:MAG: 2-oxo acid dehydrogenase subunit E2, partial [Ignavibacteriaceae bacterium]|nr:2-oxo acid dehydrogenase subunit E2 [Ignavibacteriaceae bacterium]
LRYLILWRRLQRNAFIAKKKLGTVLVSSVLMYFSGPSYGWGMSRSIHPLSILLGSITKKPAVVNNEIVIREFICLTIGFHHDLVDGAPFTRFVIKFLKLLESAYGLEI